MENVKECFFLALDKRTKIEILCWKVIKSGQVKLQKVYKLLFSIKLLIWLP